MGNKIPIPVPTGIQGDKDIPRLQESLVNLYNPGDGTILPMPGIDSKTTGEGVARAAITWQGTPYFVSGTKLVSFAEDGTKTIYGDISGTADCVTADLFTGFAIIVKGGAGYFFDGSTITQYTTNFKPSVDVTAINQRLVFCPADGGVIFYTDVGAPTVIPVANFFDAEFLPDFNTGVINIRSDLDVMGTDTTEPFRDIGESDNPFLRVDNAAIDTGYVGGRARYKGTYLFLGRDREGSFGFHGRGQGNSPKVSIPLIDEILNEEYTAEELKLVTSQRYTWKGVDFVAFRLARHTFTYYGAGWCYQQSGIDGHNQLQPWRVNHLTFAYGRYWVGDADTDDIGILTTSRTQYGEIVEYGFDTYIKQPPGTYFNIGSLELDMTTGVDVTNPTISLRMSKDGKTWGKPVWRPLGLEGEYRLRVPFRLPGGLGRFERFAGIRFRTASNCTFASAGLIADV